MKITRATIIYCSIAIVLILLGLFIVKRNIQHAEQNSMLNMPINSALGGDFILPSTLGQPLDLLDLRGQVVLMTFGYANCDDVCPIGLTRLHEVIQALGKDADHVKVIFVSFDSSNSLDGLAQYIQHFDPAIIGVTGNQQEIVQLTTRYGVVYPKEQSITGNTHFEHNGFIYLLDQQGRIRALYQNRTSVKEIVKDIQLLQKDKG